MTYQHGIDTNPDSIKGGFKNEIAVNKTRNGCITKSAYGKLPALEKSGYDIFDISTKNFAGTSASYYADIDGKREYFTIQK